MEIKTLEKKIKLLEALKKIDADIIKLDKLANMINTGLKPMIELSVIKPEEFKPITESDPLTITISMFSYSPLSSPEKKPDKESFKSEISDVFSYQILEIIIKEKNKEREKLINALTK